MSLIWKDIRGFEGVYAIYNTGLVKSYKKTVLMPEGGVRVQEERILKPGINSAGYPYVILCLPGVKVNARVHRLVAEYFLDPIEGSPWINHKDANKLNSDVSNLEFVTPKQNATHAAGLKLFKPKVRHPEVTVKVIKELLVEGFNKRQIARKFGLSVCQVFRILSGKSRQYSDGVLV